MLRRPILAQPTRRMDGYGQHHIQASAGVREGLVVEAPLETVEAVAIALACPRSQRSTQSTLARIWSTVLGRDIVRVDVSFLDYGGDSLAAMQVLHRVRDEFHVAISPAEFFASPTVQHQARMIDAALTAGCATRDEQARGASR